MTTVTEHVTTLCFHCEDLKTKRALLKLFEHPLAYGGPPSEDVLNSYYEDFKANLINLSDDCKVEFDFFRHTLFGTNFGPIATYKKKGAASVSFLHLGQPGQHSRPLVEFLISIENDLELAVESYDTDPNRYLLLKRPSGQKIESRQFDLESGGISREALQAIEEAYDWLQEGLSFSTREFFHTAADYRDQLVKAEAPIPKYSDNFDTELVDLLKQYGLLSKSVDIKNDDGNDPLSFYVEVMEEWAEDRIVFYPQLHGGWFQGELVNEYASLLTDFCKKENVSIENLQLSPPLNELGEEDPDMEMSISFTYGGKQTTWTFSMEDDYKYFSKFSAWAKSVLKGGYLWISGDINLGYILPKELVDDLKRIGINA